jgi:ribosome biogenesis protein Nip4
MKQLLILTLLSSLLLADEAPVTVKITEDMPFTYTIDSGKKVKIERIQDTNNRLTDD